MGIMTCSPDTQNFVKNGMMKKIPKLSLIKLQADIRKKFGGNAQCAALSGKLRHIEELVDLAALGVRQRRVRKQELQDC